jgi:hypothetical protein
MQAERYSLNGPVRNTTCGTESIGPPICFADIFFGDKVRGHYCINLRRNTLVRIENCCL